MMLRLPRFASTVCVCVMHALTLPPRASHIQIMYWAPPIVCTCLPLPLVRKGLMVGSLPLSRRVAVASIGPFPHLTNEP